MEADPSVMLDWLYTQDSDLQLTVLDQLCVEILFSDDMDVFAAQFPPQTFIPALCQIFLDSQASPAVLEANARAISYYLDMHLSWCHYIVRSDDVLKALSSHLDCVNMSSSKSNEFGQQLIKLLKVICSYNVTALYTAGCLTAVLRFVRGNIAVLHADVLQAGMDLIRRLFNKVSPHDADLPVWIESLRCLMDSRDHGVVDQTLRAFANMVTRFAQTGADPSPLAVPQVIACLLHRLRVAGGVETSAHGADLTGATTEPLTGLSADASGTFDGLANRISSTASPESNPVVVHAVTNILVTLCCSSTSLTHELLGSDGQFASTLATVLQHNDDEMVIFSVLRLVNILLILLYQDVDEVNKDVKKNHMSSSHDTSVPVPAVVAPDVQLPSLDSVQLIPPMSPVATDSLSTDRDILHRSAIDAIKRQDIDVLRTGLNSGSIDPNYADPLGQTLLNWAASFGTPKIVELLCTHGANVHQGVRSPLDYAATFGHAELCRVLLAHGADPNRRDNQGLRPIDRARDHLPYPGCQQVIELLEMENKHLRSTNPLTLTASAIISEEEAGDRVETFSFSTAQHIFVSRLFPALVSLFNESPSAVKRMCIFLAGRMVTFMHPDHLDIVSSMEVKDTPFAFHLARMIYSVFIEEADEFVLRALELCRCLLVKLPHTYVSVFYRFGLVPLISQLHDIWSHLLPEDVRQCALHPSTSRQTSERGALPLEETVVEARSEVVDVPAPSDLPPPTGRQLDSNQIYTWYDWHLIWVGDLLFVFNGCALVIVELHLTDGRLRALAVHGGGNHDHMPVLLHPGDLPIPRPNLKKYMLQMHQHLMEAVDNSEEAHLWPASDRNADSTIDRASRRSPDCKDFSQLLPRSSPRKAETIKNNWRRLGLHLGFRCPLELSCGSGSFRSKHKGLFQRQASSPARACLTSRPLTSGLRVTDNLSSVSDVVNVGTAVCSLRKSLYGRQLCVRMRCPASVTQPDSCKMNANIIEALLFSENMENGFSRVRISPLYFEGQGTGCVQEHDDSAEQKQLSSNDLPTSQRHYNRRQSDSLLHLISTFDSELRSDDARSMDSSESVTDVPEVYNFDVLFGVDKDMEEEQEERPDGPGSPLKADTKSTPFEVERELQRLDEMLFPRELVYETYSSGVLSDNDYLAVEGKDKSDQLAERIQSIRIQAYRLSHRLLYLLTSDSDVPGGYASPYVSRLLPTLSRLRSLVSAIEAIFREDKSCYAAVTLKSLSSVFKQLAEFLNSGEDAMTAYELAVSGLVPALLLCLSADEAASWNCPLLSVGLDSTTALLWYLHERRRIFVEHLVPDIRPPCLGYLTRRLIQAFELSEHLPLRLFASASHFPPGACRNVNQAAKDLAPQSHTRPSVSFNGFPLVSFPLGVIRASTSSATSTDGSQSSTERNDVQQFADCIDACEVAALPTFCAALMDHHRDSGSRMAIEQLNGRLPLMLEKLPDVCEDRDGGVEGGALDQLSDWTNRTIVVNPLVTASQLHKFLARVSTRQWYDNPRNTLNFWRQLKLTDNEGITFPAPMAGVNLLDSLSGVIDWLATDGGCLSVEGWVNPAVVGLVAMAASSTGHSPCILGPRAGALVGDYPVRCTGYGAVVPPQNVRPMPQDTTNHITHKIGATESQKVSCWVVVDLGFQLVPTAYSMAYLRRSDSDASAAPRNWTLEASNDGISWVRLSCHTNDTSIQPVPGSYATWGIKIPYDSGSVGTSESPELINGRRDQSTCGWRFFKIQTTDCEGLALGGLEFYGTGHSPHSSLLTAGQLASHIRESAVADASSNTVQLTPRSPPNRVEEVPRDTRTDSSCLPVDKTTTDEDSGQHAVLDSPSVHGSYRSSDDSYASSTPQGSLYLAEVDERKSYHTSVTDESPVEEDDDAGAVASDLVLRTDDIANESNEGVLSQRALDDIIPVDNQPLLHYMMMSYKSAANVRRILQNIRSQRLVSDGPMKSDLEEDVTSPQTEICEAPSERSIVPTDVYLEQTDVSEPNLVQTSLREHAADLTEIIAPKKAMATALVVSDTVDVTQESLRFIDQESVDILSPEPTHDTCAFAMNMEDVEAMEFAETIEAIIESNISSQSGPFPCVFPGATNQGSQSVTESWVPQKTFGRPSKSVKVDKRGQKCGKRRFSKPAGMKSKLTSGDHFVRHSDDHDVLSDPEPSEGCMDTTSHVAVATVHSTSSSLTSGLSEPVPVTSQDTTTACQVLSTSETLISPNPDASTNSATGPPAAMEPEPLIDVISVVKDPNQVPRTSCSPKSFQQQPRSRRPRPRPIAFSSQTHDAPSNRWRANAPPYRTLSLTWNEAVETLRLPDGLIPAFDPEPKSVNAPATTRFVLCHPPTPNSPHEILHSRDESPQIVLYLSSYSGSKLLAQIPMANRKRTLFSYIQELTDNLRPAMLSEDVLDSQTGSKAHSTPHYTLKLTYGLATTKKMSTPHVKSVGKMCLLDKNDLRLTPSLQYCVKYNGAEMELTMLADQPTRSTWQDLQQYSFEDEGLYPVSSPEQFLQLIKIIYQLSGCAESELSHHDLDGVSVHLSTPRVNVRPSHRLPVASEGSDFVSSRLTKKLMYQLHDPLALASGTLPNWCFSLTRRLAQLFSFTSRLEFLRSGAFGPTRSVSWLQNQPIVRTSYSSGVNRSFSTASSTGIQSRNVVNFSHLLFAPPSHGSSHGASAVTRSTADFLLLRSSALSQALNASNLATAIHNSPSDENTRNPHSEIRDHCSIDLNDLLRCLLNRNSNVANAAQDDRPDGVIARLHKEFVRVPRLPHELLADGTVRMYCDTGSITQQRAPGPQITGAPTFWDWATRLMEEHSTRKAELEIQFTGEDGTGLGPTLEFYSLLAAELRRRDGLMWVANDPSSTSPAGDTRLSIPTVASVSTLSSRSETQGNSRLINDDTDMDLDVEASAYVSTAHGLFPAPWSASDIPESVLYRFYILGITVAKCLQDNRRIDLPLSLPLLKLLTAYGKTILDHTKLPSATQPHVPVDRSVTCASNLSASPTEAKCSDVPELPILTNAESAFSSIMFRDIQSADSDTEIGDFLLSSHYRRLYKAASGACGSAEHWASDLLDLEDFCIVYPERAQFFRKVASFCRQKCLLTLRAGPHRLDAQILDDLAVESFGCSLEDMCISMEFLPSSKLFGFSGFPLLDRYEWEVGTDRTTAEVAPKFDLNEVEPEPVTVHNIEHFLRRTLAFCLDKGIRKQLNALKNGFEQVLPLDWLAMFTAGELGQLIAGDSVVQWTREDLLAYVVPCFGFTHDSATYQMLIDVLTNFNTLQRRAFLQFTTGCSSLPPGGLKNLQPRLRVVRKDAVTGAMPSVNTCVHYLKFPEYETQQQLQSMLLRAIREVGFYLN